MKDYQPGMPQIVTNLELSLFLQTTFIHLPVPPMGQDCENFSSHDRCVVYVFHIIVLIQFSEY